VSSHTSVECGVNGTAGLLPRFCGGAGHSRERLATAAKWSANRVVPRCIANYDPMVLLINSGHELYVPVGCARHPRLRRGCLSVACLLAA
jgi:hypothetical protein